MPAPFILMRQTHSLHQNNTSILLKYMCRPPTPTLQRIRAGKELLEAKRKEEDGAMRRLVEERKREKEEEARAR